MTIEQFQNYAPDPGSISLYFSASVISGVNVSNVECDGSNIASSLQELTSLRINILDDVYTLNVINSIAKNEYYFYDITPIVITSLEDRGCSDTQLVPYPGIGSFTNSEYNATINNVNDNTTTGFIFDVDRTRLTTTPINYGSIISGSATPASYQELNYTSIGLTNSRYEGAKTSITDYGVNSAIAAKPFSAALYLSSSTDNYICSQSLSDREVEEYLYTGNLDFPASGSRVFILNGNQVIPVRNRKVWGVDTNSIYFVDDTGYVTDSTTTCSL